MSTLLATMRAAGVATIQDGGRRGFADVGVPTSGAFHRLRYLVATALVSSGPDETIPALELLGGRLELDVVTDVVLAAVGPASLRMDGRRAAVGAALHVEAGTRAVVEHLGAGPVYVTVGGWAAARTLGSAATDTFSRLGGAVVSAAVELRGQPDPVAREQVGAFHRVLPEAGGPLRVVGAGHPRIDSLTAQAWTVRHVARSGVRLGGGDLAGSGGIPSQPMLPGAVQLTPDGEAVVLGPDGGLTGGYPVIAVVATCDLDRISELVPGGAVAFREVDVSAAAAAREVQLRALDRVVTRPRLLH